LFWIAMPLLAAGGCVHSHRDPVVFAPVPAEVVAPTSGGTVQRVYPDNRAVIVQKPIVAPGPIVAGRDLATADIIRQLFEADTGLAATARNVQIAVDDGRVIMRGTVASDHDRDELERRLARLPGVGRVDNRLELELR